MSYSADNHNTPQDVRYAPVGMGHHVTWSCLGCGQPRFTTAGSRGKGIKKRCAQCVAKKGAQA